MGNDLYAYIAALLGVVVTLAAFLTIKVARSADALRAESMKLGIEREYAEKTIRELYDRIQDSESRFREINRLLINSVDKADHVQSSQPALKSSRFLESLGIRLNEVSPDPRRVFFLTPYSNLYSAEWAAVRAACVSNGLTVRRGDEVYVQGNLLKHILTEIAKSSLIIANITSRNANVFYELGISQMMDKRVLIISHISERLEFDVAQQQVLLFHDASDLEHNLDAAIRNSFIDFQ